MHAYMHHGDNHHECALCTECLAYTMHMQHTRYMPCSHMTLVDLPAGMLLLSLGAQIPGITLQS